MAQPSLGKRGEAYPPQFQDISYGIAQLLDTTQLITSSSNGKVFVPTDGSLGTGWTEAGFDDAAWSDAVNGVGYAIQGEAQLTSGFGTRMIDVTNTQLDTTSETLNVFEGNFSPGQYQFGLDITPEQSVATINMAGGGGTFGNDTTYPDGSSGTGREDFAVRAQARVHIPQGNWTIGFGSDDGGMIKLDGVNFLQRYGTNGGQPSSEHIWYEAPRGHAWTRGTFTVSQPGGITTNLDSLFYERGGGDSFEIAIRNGHHSGNVDANNWTLLSNGSLGWTVESVATPPIPPYQSLINTDLANSMFDQNPSVTSAYLRMPFEVADASIFEIMTLRMQYDDAFVAYLNGVEIARGNIEGNPQWNSVAQSNRADEEALAAVEINLSGQLNLLNDGENILAIHGLNASGTETGFFVLPQLEVQDVLSTELSFMGEPTPGESNSQGSVGVVGEPQFNRTTSTFATSFDLEMTTDIPNAVIRYTTDGSLPTESSIPYTAPITISATTQIRARAYAPDYVASPVAVETYSKLASDVLNFSSDIPIMVIETFGSGIGTGSQTISYMTLFEPDEATGRTTLGSEPTKDSRAGMKVRGSSSAGAAKKNFALELFKDDIDDDRNVSLLGMPAESDWVLHAPDWFDRTLINNALIYDLSNQTGNYAVRTRFIEVYLNTNGGDVSSGDYHGVYVLMEKIKRDANRVNVQELSSQYTTEPDITGGYIFKFDRADPGDGGFSFSGINAGSLNLKWVEPKEEEMETPERQAQFEYVRNYMSDISSALNAPDFRHPVTGQYYGEFIDIPSFVDHHILNEVELNVDALRLSAYLYKDRGGKLMAGPLWDFDRAAESNDGRDDSPTRWYMDIESVPWWWDRVFPGRRFPTGLD